MKNELLVGLIDSINNISTVLKGQNLESTEVKEALKDLADNKGFKELLEAIEKAK